MTIRSRSAIVKSRRTRASGINVAIKTSWRRVGGVKTLIEDWIIATFFPDNTVYPGNALFPNGGAAGGGGGSLPGLTQYPSTTRYPSV